MSGSNVDLGERVVTPSQDVLVSEIVEKHLTTQAEVDRNLVYARAAYGIIWPTLDAASGEVKIHHERVGVGIDGLTEACRQVVNKQIGYVVRIAPNPIDVEDVIETIIARYTRLTGFWTHVGCRTPLEAMVIETAEQEALEQGLLSLDAVLMTQPAADHLLWLLANPHYVLAVVGVAQSASLETSDIVAAVEATDAPILVEGEM